MPGGKPFDLPPPLPALCESLAWSLYQAVMIRISSLVNSMPTRISAYAGDMGDPTSSANIVKQNTFFIEQSLVRGIANYHSKQVPFHLTKFIQFTVPLEVSLSKSSRSGPTSFSLHSRRTWYLLHKCNIAMCAMSCCNDSHDRYAGFQVNELPRLHRGTALASFGQTLLVAKGEQNVEIIQFIHEPPSPPGRAGTRIGAACFRHGDGGFGLLSRRQCR